MIRLILLFGFLPGLLIIPVGFATGGYGHHGSVLMGYLLMLVALSAVLVGVKQYRDKTLGGVIKFTTAFLLGLGIAIGASIAYVLAWEVYLAMTHYSFMAGYVDHVLAAKRAAGVTGAEYAKLAAQMEAMRVQYNNPLYRLPMTFIEIFPVGLLVAVVSAALLRNSKFLPARSRAVAA